MSKNFVQLSPLFILEVGHLDSVSKICENDIEDEIYISHNGKRIRYSLLGYTIHTGLHFSMKTRLRDCWYIYDGIEQPKLKRVLPNTNSSFVGRINCIVYVCTHTDYES